MKEYAYEKQAIQWSLYKVFLKPVQSGFLFGFGFHFNKHLLITYYMPIILLGFYEKSLSQFSS